MAGYSGTPLPTKLGIKPSVRIALVGAPAGFRRTLGPLPEGVVESMEGEASLDLVLYFTKDRAELERRFSKLAARLDPAGALRAAWPERSSGVPTDRRRAWCRASAWRRAWWTTRCARWTRSGRRCGSWCGWRTVRSGRDSG